MRDSYDALLLVSFGGPEKPDDVIPFLENVLRGKNVPHGRLLEVAEHYYQFGGKSPINEQNRALIAALETELERHGPHLPVYWGNRNWHPLLANTVRRMTADGVTNALAFMTSAYSSYSGCRQYREDVLKAQAEVGPSAPQISKIRAFYNHPGFVEPMAERVRAALEQVPAERRSKAHVAYTAHSIPLSMAETSRYQEQLLEACHLVSERLFAGTPHGNWRLVYQSRSGPPSQPWLEPDIKDHLRNLNCKGDSRDVVVAPIGFISDHLEVLFDLDTEARAVATELGLNMVRAASVGTHPQFISMIRELVVERMEQSPNRRALGILGPSHDVCALDCCPAPRRPAAG